MRENRLGTPQCPENHRRPSRCLAVVVVQEGAEPRASNDRAGCSIVVREPSPGVDELTIDALVKAFPQIVRHEFRDHMTQMMLPEEDEVI